MPILLHDCSAMSRDNGGRPRNSFTTRRNVLLTLGAGSSLTALGGSVTANSHTADGGQHNNRSDQKGGKEMSSGDDCPPCIDDLMGYASLSMELDVPAALQPDHTVEMRLDDADVLFPEEGETDEIPDGPSIDPADGEGPGVTEEVEGFPDFYYDPVGLAVEVGDVVEFPNPSPGEHTVTAIHPRFFGLPQRIPDGAAPLSSPPVMPGENWLYQFDEPGVYDLFCLPHFDLGMAMRIIVTTGNCTVSEVSPPSNALPPTVAAVLGADALAPANVVNNGPIAWTDLKGQIPTFNPDELFGGEM